MGTFTLRPGGDYINGGSNQFSQPLEITPALQGDHRILLCHESTSSIRPSLHISAHTENNRLYSWRLRYCSFSRSISGTNLYFVISSTSSFIMPFMPLILLIPTALLTITASNHLQRLGLPVVAPYSSPIFINSPSSPNNSVGKGPSPTRVV